MTYQCTYRRANGRQCRNAAQPGRSTCKRHHEHGSDVQVLKSRKHSGITGFGERQHAKRPLRAIG